MIIFEKRRNETKQEEDYISFKSFNEKNVQKNYDICSVTNEISQPKIWFLNRF